MEISGTTRKTFILECDGIFRIKLRNAAYPMAENGDHGHAYHNGRRGKIPLQFWKEQP